MFRISYIEEVLDMMKIVRSLIDITGKKANYFGHMV